MAYNASEPTETGSRSCLALHVFSLAGALRCPIKNCDSTYINFQKGTWYLPSPVFLKACIDGLMYPLPGLKFSILSFRTPAWCWIRHSMAWSALHIPQASLPLYDRGGSETALSIRRIWLASRFRYNPNRLDTPYVKYVKPWGRMIFRPVISCI